MPLGRPYLFFPFRSDGNPRQAHTDIWSIVLGNRCMAFEIVRFQPTTPAANRWIWRVLWASRPGDDRFGRAIGRAFQSTMRSLIESDRMLYFTFQCRGLWE